MRFSQLVILFCLIYCSGIVCSYLYLNKKKVYLTHQKHALQIGLNRKQKIQGQHQINQDKMDRLHNLIRTIQANKVQCGTIGNLLSHLNDHLIYQFINLEYQKNELVIDAKTQSFSSILLFLHRLQVHTDRPKFQLREIKSDLNHTIFRLVIQMNSIGSDYL
jgi:hypothetical protein